jgi:GntR family transcriptional repressor for pyruvate dehydrogenase complex
MTDEPRPNLTDRVEDELRRQINIGTWRPGQSMPSEGRLAVQFEVSRTVVREAMARLRAAGVVETGPGRPALVLTAPVTSDFARSIGTTVATMDDRLLVLELRRGIETEAAALAASRCTPTALASVDAALTRMEAVSESASDAVDADFAFHRAVAVASANRFFVNLLDTFGAGVITRPYAGAERPHAHVDHVLGEHRAIRTCIAAKDALGAAAAMRTHLDSSRARMCT